MKIAVIGTGNVGGVLGTRWAKNGHQVCFGSRTPESERIAALLATAGPRASASLPRDAAKDASVIVLAVPYPAVEETIGQLGGLAGKVVIDPTNPLNEDTSDLVLGTTTSSGEQIASLLPESLVVKAFNMTGAIDNMVNPIYGDQKLSMFICGDDARAKSVVGALVSELDFEVVDCGPLTSSRYLEPLARLWITLAAEMNMGGDIGFRLIRR